ncbi:phosphate ABC transporter substrate-binding protein [Erwinia billingiae]|uniref:phosphate/phosphite/phosphonate ABC transporter substrate-binding protein n=1 Tax=Erwinia billingiae TaxID=182337 RepID=UPI001248711F|nr:PhnD/SsuA/transferrin family substrate-binding protein [Erwinia billingiae]QEW30810.1 phosphate ABC transporter substrate-binding protein [Erwinia billingiae]
MIASLPMYPFTPQHVEAFWQTLRNTLPSLTTPTALSWPDPLLPHWQRDDLLLSQTCGYPLVTLLPDVQVVGAFCYSAAGCDGPNYTSWLVVREEESGQALADFAGRRLAFNSEDSQSGYHSVMKMTGGPAIFSATVASGGHRRSVALVRRGQADIAAIDCISWALLQRDFPEELRGLKIIDQTASVPGLPVITSARTSAETLAALREGLTQVVTDVANRPMLDALLIKDFTPLPRSAWQVLLA